MAATFFRPSVTYFLPQQQKREIETVMDSLCDLFPYSTIAFSLLIFFFWIVTAFTQLMGFQNEGQNKNEIHIFQGGETL